MFPEILAAQKRLKRLEARQGTTAALHAYDIARMYLENEWSADVRVVWYTERRYRRAEAAPSVQKTSWLPSWARHPESPPWPSSSQARTGQSSQFPLPTADTGSSTSACSPPWGQLALEAISRSELVVAPTHRKRQDGARDVVGVPSTYHLPGSGRHVAVAGQSRLSGLTCRARNGKRDSQRTTSMAENLPLNSRTAAMQ